MNGQKHFSFMYVSAFLFPILILTIVFAMFSISPFGTKTALTVDLYHQYIHYYSYYLDALKGNGSLLYSWNAGLGSNFIGDIAYYTSSPLLFILLLFPKALYPEAILLLILIKIGLCGLTISFYIRKKFTAVKPFEVVLFASFYALMSYTITYYYNVMWLDGVILLPVLILSIDSMMQNKSFIPYTCFLSLLMIANFYIAYMVGLFCFLYFMIDYFILLKRKPEAADRKAILLKFLGGTFISIGITAFLTAPTFFELLNTFGPKAQSYHYQVTFQYLLKLLCGVYDSDIDGTPNIFIGSFVLLLVPAFFIGKINKAEKIKWSSLFVIIAISFVVPSLNLFWHAEDIPNWFPFRYSFLLSFVLLNMSLSAYEKLPITRFRTYLLLLVVNVILLTIAFISKIGSFHYADNVLFLAFFCIIIYIKKFGLLKIELFAFLLFTIMQLWFNSSFLIGHVYKELGVSLVSDYSIYSGYSNAVEQIKKVDSTLFYRISTDLNKTDNDSLTIGSGSLSHSSSMINNDLKTALNSLGFSTRSVGYSVKGSSLLTDSILGMKYLISSQKVDNPNFEQTAKADNLFIYKNKTYLPIGYPVENRIKAINPSAYQNPLLLQNKLFQTIIKTNADLFKPISPVTIVYENASIKEGKNGERFTRLNKKSPIKITYIFRVASDDDLYALIQLANDHKLLERPTITMAINNQKSRKYFPSQVTGGLDMGTFPGKEAVMELEFNQNQVKFANDPLFYRMDVKELQKYMVAIDRNSFQITQIKGNTFQAKGTMPDEKQLLFLSIPWDDGWKVTVNGEKVKPIKVLGDFMGIPVHQGHYQLQMTFMPKGFLAGCFISLVSLFVFLFIILKKHKFSGRVKE